MTTPHDRFARLDAAYAMGGLDAAQTREFEAHLAGCAQCRTAVTRARAMLALLATVDAPTPVDEAPPDTVLPGLLRRAARERARRRVAVAAAGVVAAACVAGLAVGLWPADGNRPVATATRPPAARDFVPTTQTPVRANASLVSKEWGTQIDIHCSYAVGVDQPYRYRLRVIDVDGEADDLGGWQVPPRGDVSYVSGTSVSARDIRTVQILRMDGTPVLELVNR